MLQLTVKCILEDFYLFLFPLDHDWLVSVVQWIKYLTLPLSHKLYVVLFILFCFWSPGPR